MKQAVIPVVILFGASPVVLAQSVSQNYVQTQTMLNARGEYMVTEVQYHDGLGRPEIQVTTGLGTSGNSTKYVYDADGTKLKVTWKTKATNALYSMAAAEETGAEAEADDRLLSAQSGESSVWVENSREYAGPFVFTDGKLDRARRHMKTEFDHAMDDIGN